jgi:hypothetical protein
MGGTAAVLSFLPRLSISPEPPLISSDAFSTPFQVSNDGYFSIYRVNAGCTPKDVTYVEPNHPKHGLHITGSGTDEEDTAENFMLPNLESAELLPDHKLIFPCSLREMSVPPEWLVSAHILMVINFHTPFVPFVTRHHRQRFELVRDSAGQLRWLEEAAK